MRWLAVVAVMQEESCDTNLVCSLLPHTRRYALTLKCSAVHFVSQLLPSAALLVNTEFKKNAIQFIYVSGGSSREITSLS